MSRINNEIIEKYRNLMHDRSRLIGDRDYIARQIEENTKQLADCVAAARLFGVTLGDTNDLNPDDIKEALSEPNAEQKTIRNFCISVLRQNWPKAVRAKDIRHIYQTTYNKTLHDKTIGMTLYRLSREEKAKRDGWDWHYIPTPDEQREIDEHHHE